MIARHLPSAPELRHLATRLREVLRDHPNPARFFASRILWQTRLCRFFSIERSGYRLHFFPTALSATLWVGGDRGVDEEFVTRYLRPRDRVVDVGANIGSIALTAAGLVGPQGSVLAFEAHPRTFEFLLRNITLNGFANIRARHAAVGDHEGWVTLSDDRTDDQNHVVRDRGIRVPVTPLDALNLPEIGLLKLDVEGFETFVLAGARQTLRRTACVYFESWDEHVGKYDCTCEDAVRLLREAGFRVWQQRQDTLLEVASPHRSPTCENLIAVRDLDDFVRRTGYRVSTPPAQTPVR
jgi:FkbM family methyltransferase